MPRARRSIMRIGVSASILLLVLIGWSGFWGFAAHRSAALLDAWILREQAAGRQWTCLDRRIGGFPLGIEISCAGLSFDGAADGKTLTGAAQGLHAVASLAHPTRVDAQVASPFTLRADDATLTLTLRWARLDLVLSGLPQEVNEVLAQADQPAIEGRLGGFAPFAGRAAKAEARIARQPSRTDAAYDFQIGLDAASIPVVDAIFGAAQQAGLRFAGTVTQADFRAAASPQARIEDWRLAGGHIDLTDASLTSGPTKLDGKGVLGLDEGHRLRGRFDAQGSGLEPVLQRFGVNPGLVGAGALLSSLFGGKPRQSEPQAAPSLRLPLIFDDGWLVIGPVRTSVRLPPLY